MTALLNIGTSALSAAQGTLATISHNIANANTDGYSRQEAVLSTAGGLYSGSGFYGRGVDLTTVRRQYDQFLTSAVQSATSTSAADATRASGLKPLDSLFANSQLGIGASIDQLFSAAGDVANRPSDLTSRQAFVSQASDLATRLSQVGGELQKLSTAANAQLSPLVTQVNARLTDIKRLNTQIAQATGSGQPPNDLLDQRDAALKSLNGLMSVSSVSQNDGTISLFTQSGAPLLVGNQQSVLAGVQDKADPSRTAIELTVVNAKQTLDASAIGGGSIGGTLRLRDDDIASAVNQIGRIAQVVASVFNSQQSLGVDMNGAQGAQLFNIAGPKTIPNAANAGATSMSVSVSSATALQASSYDVKWDGSNYTMTRLADGQATTSATLPATLDGLTFNAGGAPAAGDSWRVEPFSQAATSISARAVNARQIATGFASTIEAAATNKGSAAASGFSVTRASTDNALAVSITFNNPPTSYNVTGLAGGNLSNVAYTAGDRVPTAPADYNGWSVKLDGTPVAGDTFNVKANTAPGTDNRNALAMQSLADMGLVSGATLNEAYAAVIGDVGTRVQSSQDTADISGQLQADAVSRQQNVAGVNLDEEAANLLRYQQAYQASARIIQASQTLFDALLSAVAR